MNDTEKRLLKIVAEHPRIRAVDISRKHKIDYSNISVLLNRLHRQGLLKKVKLGMSVYYSMEFDTQSPRWGIPPCCSNCGYPYIEDREYEKCPKCGKDTIGF